MHAFQRGHPIAWPYCGLLLQMTLKLAPELSVCFICFLETRLDPPAPLGFTCGDPAYNLETSLKAIEWKFGRVARKNGKLKHATKSVFRALRVGEFQLGFLQNLLKQRQLSKLNGRSSLTPLNNSAVGSVLLQNWLGNSDRLRGTYSYPGAFPRLLSLFPSSTPRYSLADYQPYICSTCTDISCNDDAVSKFWPLNFYCLRDHWHGLI